MTFLGLHTVDWFYVLSAWLILGLLIGARLGLIIRRADETAPSPEFTDLAVGLPAVPVVSRDDVAWLQQNGIDAGERAS